MLSLSNVEHINQILVRTVLAAVAFFAAGFFATFFLSAGLDDVADFLAAVAFASPAGRLAAALA